MKPGATPGVPVPLGTLLVREILASTVINILFNAFFSWLMFAGGPIRLWGSRGVAVDCLPASFIPAAMMTLAITALLRHRLRRGLLVTGIRSLPLLPPRRLVPRALAIGVAAIALVALPTIAVLAAVAGAVWSWAGLIAFKLAFSLLHAAIMTPIVVLAALQYEAKRPTP